MSEVAIDDKLTDKQIFQVFLPIILTLIIVSILTFILSLLFNKLGLIVEDFSNYKSEITIMENKPQSSATFTGRHKIMNKNFKSISVPHLNNCCYKY